MKRIMLLIILSLILGSAVEAKHFYRMHGRFEVFYSSLSPYGGWVNCRFGSVWRPYHIAHGWRPYLHGRWVWTDYGWYWVSYEPFGWATFHYGRWYNDDDYGWIWIPDDVWGPAWVEWRYDDDYIGWAPLTPYARFSLSIGITLATDWAAPFHYWNFVGCNDFTATRLNEYIQPLDRNQRLFGNTRGTIGIRPDGNRVINRGIDVGFIERRTKTRIDHVDVVTQDQRRGERVFRDQDRERIEVYRPRIEGQTRSEIGRTPRSEQRERMSTPRSVRPDNRGRFEQPREPMIRRDDERMPQYNRLGRERDRGPMLRQPTEKRSEPQQIPRQEWRMREPQKSSRAPMQRQEPPRQQQRPRDRVRR